MKKRLAAVLAGVLALILAVSGAMLLRQYLDGRQAERERRESAETAGVTLPEHPLPAVSAEPAPPAEDAPPAETPEVWDPYALELARTDLAALREVNGDVAGWLYIRDTNISYPLMQAADNEYYLSHAWNNRSSGSGSIFLECMVDAGFGDFNTIVYGHNMRSDSMFSGLKEFAEQGYWREHPSVYIAAEDGVRRYDIYSAWEAALTDSPYRLKITRQEDKRAFLQESLDRSLIQTGIVPTEDDQILTLSTCTGRGHTTRWVVQAVLAWHGTTPPL